MTQRIEKIAQLLKAGQCLIITDSNNRFYFTGFRSSAGTVVITRDKCWFLIDFRYYEKAKHTVKSAQVLLATKLYSQISQLLKENGVTEVFIETDNITVDGFKSLQKALSDFKISGDSTFTQKIAELRSIKDKNEIAQIKKAQYITDEAFKYILNKIHIGMTEIEVALEMEFYMRSGGSEGAAFEFIVVSGKNSSLPHGVPTHKKIEKGDFITMDFGGVVGGYRSDMTRTVSVGSVSADQRKVYETVLAAQNEAFKIIAPGAVCCEVDKSARDYIANAGFGECFGHGLGHSVGLEIHENPAFNTRDNTILVSGMIMTVEPGIYLENKYGVRIEDMVTITEQGFENLTKSPKELIILD